MHHNTGDHYITYQDMANIEINIKHDILKKKLQNL